MFLQFNSTLEKSVLFGNDFQLIPLKILSIHVAIRLRANL